MGAVNMGACMSGPPEDGDKAGEYQGFRYTHGDIKRMKAAIILHGGTCKNLAETCGLGAGGDPSKINILIPKDLVANPDAALKDAGYKAVAANGSPEATVLKHAVMLYKHIEGMNAPDVWSGTDAEGCLKKYIKACHKAGFSIQTAEWTSDQNARVDAEVDD